MSLEEDFGSKPIPQEKAPAEKKWPIDVEKLSPEERDEIVERINALKAREREQEALQAELDEKIARNDRFIDNNAAIERGTANLIASAQPEVAPIVSEEAKLQRVIAGNDAMIANNISQEKLIDAFRAQHTEPNTVEAPTFDVDALDRQVQVELENAGIKRQNETIRNELTGKLAADIMRETILPAAEADPSIIAPQTEEPVNHPAFENKHTESPLDTAARIGGNAAELVADRFPHSIVGRAWAKVERFGIKMKNAPTWAGLETMRQYRLGSTAKAEAALAGAKKELEAAEAKLATKDASIEQSKAKLSSGGLFDRFAAAKLARERDSVVAQVEKAKAKFARAQATFEFKKSKSNYWEERLEHQSNTIAAGVDQRLAGDRAAIETLNHAHQMTEEKLEKLSKNIEAVQADILLFEVRLKAKPELAEKTEIKNGLTEAKAKLTELRATYATLGKEKSRIMAKASRAKLYVSGWDSMSSATK